MAATLDLAITAIRSQRQEEGRQLLNLLIQENPNNEMAWLWMSSVVDTDEQRARCLYHVLAINPDSSLARRGLEKLGIMVSDSRPVKVPRDSQPIRIPKPSPPGEATPLPPISKPVKPIAPPKPEAPPEPIPEPETPPEPVPEPASTPEPETPPEPIPEPETPPEESKPPAPKQRPFRIDPQTITDELPFIPLRSPFGAAQTKPEISTSDSPQTEAQAEAHPFPELAQAMKFPPQAKPESEEEIPAEPQAEQKPADPTPPQNGQAPHRQNPPPDEVQTIASPAQNGHTVATQPSVSSANFQQSRPDSGPMAPYQYPLTGPGMLQETRPTQPAIASGMPMGYYHSPHPSEPVPAVHSNMTMGMSTPYPQYQYSQPVLHSNTTMMMGPTTLPSEPVTGGSPYWQQGQPLNPPPAPPKPSPAKNEPDSEEEDGEEVNLLAVIIFGSLSVTALGGLGMLILLMFTTV